MNRHDLIFELSTTGSDPEDIFSLDVNPAGEAVLILIEVIAIQDDYSNTFGGTMEALFLHDGATLVQVGSTIQNTNNTAGFAAVNIQFTISSDRIFIQAVGIAATNINWEVEIEYHTK
jgi:hypothetical protein